MLVTDLVSFLLAQSSLTSIIGNRVLPIPAPVDLSEYPCITYQVVSDVSNYTLTGSDGVSQTRVVFDCIAPRYLDACSLALALKATLNGYSGTLTGGTHIFQSAIGNILDRWDDGSKLSCTSVHVLLTYSD